MGSLPARSGAARWARPSNESIRRRGGEESCMRRAVHQSRRFCAAIELRGPDALATAGLETGATRARAELRTLETGVTRDARDQCMTSYAAMPPAATPAPIDTGTRGEHGAGLGALADVFFGLLHLRHIGVKVRLGLVAVGIGELERRSGKRAQGAEGLQSCRESQSPERCLAETWRAAFRSCGHACRAERRIAPGHAGATAIEAKAAARIAMTMDWRRKMRKIRFIGPSKKDIHRPRV